MVTNCIPGEQTVFMAPTRAEAPSVSAGDPQAGEMWLHGSRSSYGTWKAEKEENPFGAKSSV